VRGTTAIHRRSSEPHPAIARTQQYCRSEQSAGVGVYGALRLEGLLVLDLVGNRDDVTQLLGRLLHFARQEQTRRGDELSQPHRKRLVATRRPLVD
jgi:hypothetical protein